MQADVPGAPAPVALASSHPAAAGDGASEALLQMVNAEVERCLGAIDIARRDLDAAGLRILADRADLDARAAVFAEVSSVGVCMLVWALGAV